MLASDELLITVELQAELDLSLAMASMATLASHKMVLAQLQHRCVSLYSVPSDAYDPEFILELMLMSSGS